MWFVYNIMKYVIRSLRELRDAVSRSLPKSHIRQRPSWDRLKLSIGSLGIVTSWDGEWERGYVESGRIWGQFFYSVCLISMFFKERRKNATRRAQFSLFQCLKTHRICILLRLHGFTFSAKVLQFSFQASTYKVSRLVPHYTPIYSYFKLESL